MKAELLIPIALGMMLLSLLGLFINAFKVGIVWGLIIVASTILPFFFIKGVMLYINIGLTLLTMFFMLRYWCVVKIPMFLFIVGLILFIIGLFKFIESPEGEKIIQKAQTDGLIVIYGRAYNVKPYMDMMQSYTSLPLK